MILLLTLVFTILFICVPSSYALFDQSLCPDGLSSPIPDPKWSTIPLRFEIITELVSGNEAIELSQAFSTNRDSVAINSAAGGL